MKQSPPVVLRWGPIALALAPIVCTLLAAAILWSRVNLYTLGAVFLGSQAIATVASVLLVRSIRKKVRRHDGEVCVRCVYALSGLPAPGVCPECGTSFPSDRHRSMWKGWEMLR